MNRTMNIELIGDNFTQNPKRSPIKGGPLTMPEDVRSIHGDVIAIGENDDYLHCIMQKTGSYFGIFKSDDPKHLWGAILRLNSPIEDRP